MRRIISLEVEEEGSYLRIRVRGTGFLYNMVRIIAGTLIQVGLGQKKPENLPAILAARDRSQAGPTAPPQGLCLMEIALYPDGFPAD